MTRVGGIFNPYTHPAEALPGAARAAEAAGLAELWLWEDCFRESAFAPAAAALAATSTLEVGIGIAPMPLRNAAATAMEIASLARLFPGRLLPGVGHGVQAWMAQVGARVASPLTLMREYVPAVRALVAGERVTTSGRSVSLDAVQLDWPPDLAPRIYAAAAGPKTLALAGAVADGVVLDNRRTVDEIAASVAAVREGRTAAGRDGTPEIVAYVSAAFVDGGSGADDPGVNGFGTNDAGLDNAGLDNAGLDNAVRRILADWDGGAVGPDAPDARLRMLVGTPAGVAEGVRRYAAAGVDHVVLLAPFDEPDMAAYYRKVGEVARLVG
jgi:alkanesulfonate monooxygenase SsuD/methylene tetrahydromethanopterin reductase-like flavin-dependent oxidoreductase (luciferase family)